MDATRTLTLLVVWITLTLQPSSAWTLEPQPGQIYSSGTTLSITSLGVSLNIPEGWRAALSPDGEALQMEPLSGGAMLLAFADTMNQAKALETMQGPIPLDSGLQLHLEGQVTQAREGELSASYRIPYQPNLSALGHAQTDQNGTSIALFLIAPVADLATLKPSLQAAANSVTFNKRHTSPTTSKTVTQGASKDLWADYLKGKHIVRFFSGSGYTEEQHIWLCSDGGYYRSFNGGGWGGGASGAAQSHYTGQWRATGAGEHGQLHLHNQSGAVSTYQLRWDFAKSHLYVDGKRWLHDENKACR